MPASFFIMRSRPAAAASGSSDGRFRNPAGWLVVMSIQSLSCMNPWQRYQADLERPGFSHDPAQERAVQHLQAIYEALQRQPQPNALQRLTARLRQPQRAPVKGLYLWGGAGRGKTDLMDECFDSVPFKEEQRLHVDGIRQLVHDDV